MSDRAHKRDVRAAHERKVRKVYRRFEILRRARWKDKVYEPLDEPVFWGYRRFFVLRDDIAARKDSAKWQKILDLVQNEEFSRRKDFKYRRWPSRRWIESDHEPATFRPYTFGRKVPARYKEYFRFFYINGQKEYYFIYPWMFVSRRKKVYHTHREVLDLELIRELGYLEDIIDQRLYQQTWARLKRGRYGWRHWTDPTRKKIRDNMHQNDIEEALQEYWEGEMITLLDLKKELENAET